MYIISFDFEIALFCQKSSEFMDIIVFDPDWIRFKCSDVMGIQRSI